MSDVPFHLTRGGRTFYEHTLPEIARQLALLNETLARIAVALEARGPNETTEPKNTEGAQ